MGAESGGGYTGIYSGIGKRGKHLAEKYSNEKIASNNADSDKDDSQKKIASGIAATEAAVVSTRQAAVEYAQPNTYTGNRALYDSASAKRQAKEAAFSSGKDVIDPYTGKKLVKTVKEAKSLYGDDWQSHLAESDHIRPLEKIFDENKNNPWLKSDNIKKAANSDYNVKPVSRLYNNQKRSHSNKEMVENEVYYKSKGLELTPEGKKAALKDDKTAGRAINGQLAKDTVENIVNTGHKAGTSGAVNVGKMTLTMSGIMNIVDVVKGEKDVGEAIGDIVVDTGKAAATGYVMSSGLTVVSHTLSKSSSFIQALTQSNIPGTVITAVAATGDTLKRYASGEITTQECLLELGDKGLSTITTGYSIAVGQALIPIPVVGAAVGALVGSVMTSKYYGELMNTLKIKELEHQERLRIIAECEQATAQARAFREELESYLEAYFKDYQDCFDDALSEIQYGYQTGDAESMVSGANRITQKLGGQVRYKTMGEFKSFLYGKNK